MKMSLRSSAFYLTSVSFDHLSFVIISSISVLLLRSLHVG
jgi:hypothetical protein